MLKKTYLKAPLDEKHDNGKTFTIGAHFMATNPAIRTIMITKETTTKHE